MGSEILIVVTGAIALMVLAAGYYLITPLFLEIQQNPTAACAANDNCSDIFDRSYDIWFIIFMVFTGGIFLSLYMRAVRRDSVETVEGF